MKCPPVIILGMHRSGTAMLARILEELGLFWGAKKEANNEAVFFVTLNEWMLRESDATWAHPNSFLTISEAFKKKTTRILRNKLHSIKRLEFLGLRNFIRYKDIRHLDIPWGWKDPRNTLTIDIWKEIFPDPTILHIYRNPLDVAESLRKREHATQKIHEKGLNRVLRNFLFTRKLRYNISLKLQNIFEGIRLWEIYVNKAFSMNNQLPGRILHIKYERFVEYPYESLLHITDFCDLQINKSEISTAIREVKSDRRYNFTNDDFLMEVYDKIKDQEIMKRLDYSTIEKEVMM